MLLNIRISMSSAYCCALFPQVQDNNLLDSETCVHFLLKLLNPPVNVVDVKAPSIGSKLLGISKFQMLNGAIKMVTLVRRTYFPKLKKSS